MNRVLEDYFDREIILTRFTTFEDLKNKINKRLESYDLKIKCYDFKSDYDNDFEDYKVDFAIYKGDEFFCDLYLWYAITRIGERIIVESNFDGGIK